MTPRIGVETRYRHTIYFEQHGNHTLVKLKRTNKTVMGISEHGKILIGAISPGELADEEWLDLLTVKPQDNAVFAARERIVNGVY